MDIYEEALQEVLIKTNSRFRMLEIYLNSRLDLLEKALQIKIDISNNQYYRDCKLQLKTLYYKSTK